MTQTVSGIESTKPIRTFLKVGTCSEAMFNIVDRAFDDPMKLEEHASSPLAGGIVQRGYQCGMVWGATLAAGLQAFRRHGPGPKAEAEAIRAAQGIVEAMREHKGSEDCYDITGADMRKRLDLFKYMIGGKAVGCFRMASSYAPLAFEEINAAFDESSVEAPEPPVSCAAMVAQQMGASEMHTTMAAGLAGGIGLCGGGCGALGAAIWLDNMKDQEGASYKEMNDSAEGRVGRFVESTGGEFECSAIVGRQFKSVEDHARFLREGGCSKLMEVCAAS